MRVLLYAGWHHFAFLVISVVLLGFGASGTVLSFLRRWILPRCETAMIVLVLAASISMLASVQLLRDIPAEARFVPALLTKQILLWGLYWAVLFVPFLLGASGICLALMAAGSRLPTVYAANLGGSAIGALIAPWAMHFLPPGWLASLMGVVTLTGIIPLPGTRAAPRLGAAAAAGAVFLVWLWIDPPRIRVDPFKYQHFVDRLVEDERASRVAVAYGPRAVVDVYEGEAFHEMAFLAVGETPPPMLAVLMDGHWAGSILRVRDAKSAGAVENTLMSVPYSFVEPRPRVLLLGEIGGANIWLAARHQSESIHVVQPNKELMTLLSGPLHERGGRVVDLPSVDTILEEPRHFVESTGTQFDLVQLVTLESWAVETGGVAGLRQDNLITIEGLAACIERLAPGGVISACRGVQTPPRDNIKILAALIEALRTTGVDSPERHIVVLRDYLAVCTLVKRSPWTREEIEDVRSVCRRRELTPVYFAGIRDDELNTPDRLPGPPGEAGDWLHHAAAKLVSPNSGTFIDEWPFDVRPPTDDRPFFANFGKVRSIGVLKHTFGDLWLTRTELALLFVLAAMIVIAIAGAVLTVIPLLFVRDIRGSRGRSSTSLYFVSIGLGYLMVEITMLSRLIHLIGDPVQAGALTIAGFLFFSGVGSLTAQRVRVSDAQETATDSPRSSGLVVIRRLLLVLVLVGFIELWTVKWTIASLGSLAPMWRVVWAIVVIGPLGFLMGFPMPTALRRLEQTTPALIPWAWGVNGFASVLAPPLATAIGMTWGFRTAGSLALFFYLVAAVIALRLPGGSRERLAPPRE